MNDIPESSNANPFKELTMFPRQFFLARIVACSLFLTLPLVGVAADGKLTGRITLSGKPLTGKITFHWKDQFAGAKVNKDGTYAVDRLQTGTYTVTVEGKGVPVKYTLEDKSSLKVEVKEGDNTLDFDLQ